MKLWEEAVQRSPHAWQARLGHADLLREIRRCDLAVPEYEAALALNPDEPQAAAGLSSCR